MTLLERGLPIDEINELSKVEKGPGRPPHWEMVFWWTRKPLAGARAIIAAALLDDINPQQFLTHLFPCRGERKTVHTCNPSPRLVERLRGKKLLDPFAGFGSIPLEALRLGLDATAVELLPTAYVFLKAVLEYPKWAAERRIDLAKEVEKWGRWVVERLREDPDVKGLYGDAAVYIGTWEVKCPACGRHTPLVGNWWLARVKKGSEYERLAWMEWNNGVRVVDLGRVRAEVKARGEEGEGGVVKAGGREYRVPAKNIDARRETARCLHCGAEINHRAVDGKIVKPSAKKKVGDWYVKWALRQWNERYERYLRGETTLEELRGSPARPTLLVKVRAEGRDLRFEPADGQDVEKLWKAAEKLREMWGDPDIPTEPVSPYSNRYLFPILYGFDEWFKLFNPRQLLALLKLVKLIREAGRLAEEEKLGEGWGREDAHKYAEAVTTYLAVALCKYVDYSSIVAGWNRSLIMGHSLSMRGIAMMWNWDDMSPWTMWTGTYVRSVNTVIESLSYLVSAVSGSPGGVRVLLDDAASLSKLEGEVFDVVLTDPPYADDVPYAELSDFYYVWLKRALSGVDGGRLVPRFLPEAFFDEFGEEVTTQWQFFAPREVSENEGRFEYFKMREGFADLLARAFSNILRFLKPEGLLVVYYVAKKPEAWVALVDALWRRSGLVLTAAYPVATESEESVVARGKASVLGGFVAAWRRREAVDGEGIVDLADPAQRAKVVELVAKEFEKYRAFSHDFFVYAYVAGLSALLRFKEVRYAGAVLDVESVLGAATSIGFEGALRFLGVEVRDPYALAYLLLRTASERGVVDSDTVAYVQYATGLSDGDMVKAGLLEPVESGGANVAKRKSFRVVAPAEASVPAYVSALGKVRGRSKVLEAFREAEAGALSPSFKFDQIKAKFGEEVFKEVLALCRAFVKLCDAGVLSKDDPDVKAAEAILGASSLLM
uniref:DUF1156 domain-containing protein n=1 Tax=Pyrobaculum calidifontis TaxID=181486 RepID=UPI00186B6D78|nr:DUF1156 domain-containing protein [Pyrobaculum calidifontis]